MAIADDALTTLKPLPYAKIRGMVQDGDLLLCSAHDTFSMLIRWATKSQWSHVAIALRIEQIDRVMVLECVAKIGVRAVPLSDFIRRTSSGTTPYPGRILLARHSAFEGANGQARMKKLAKFAMTRLGERFSNREALKIVLRILLGRLNIRLHANLGPDDEFICSEYVAKALQHAGVKVPWDGLGFVAPSDIAAAPEVSAIAQVRTR